jgi:hypothetical protein
LEYVDCTNKELREHLAILCGYYNATRKHGDFIFDVATVNFDIDHFLPLKPVVPINKAELHRRLHWTNLRPMPHRENIAKGNREPKGPSPSEERESAAVMGVVVTTDTLNGPPTPNVT